MPRLPLRLLVLRLVVALAGLAAAPAALAQLRYAWRLNAPNTGVTVHAAALDGRGMVVVGTSRGLYRYDGLSFEPIPLGPGPVGGAWRVEASPTGGLWTLLYTHGLVYVSPAGVATRVALPAAFAPWAHALTEGARVVRPDTAGVWVGLAGELWHYTRAAQRWERRPYPEQRGLGAYALGRDTLWLIDQTRLGFARLDAAGRPTATRWIGTVQGYGYIEAHPRGGVWIAQPDGVYRLTVAPGTATARWRRVSPDGYGSAWFARAPSVGADGSLFTAAERRGFPETYSFLAFDPSGRLRLEEPSTPFFANGPLLIDREQGLWAVTGEGLAHLDRPYLRLLDLVGPGNRPDEAFRTLPDPRGRGLWVSTFHGASHLDASGALRRLAAGRESRELFVSVDDDGAAYFVRWPDARGPGWYRTRPGHSPVPVRELPLVRLSDGSRVVNRPDGLYRVAAGRARRVTPQRYHFMALPFAASLPNGRPVAWMVLDNAEAVVGDSLVSACRRCVPEAVRALHDTLRAANYFDWTGDRHGRIWLAGVRGLEAFWYDGQRYQHERFLVGDEATGDVQSVAVSPDGARLWVGTSHGVVGFALPGAGRPRLGAPRFVLSRRFALGGEAVRNVAEGPDGMLWATVSPGRVHRIDWRAMRPEPSPAVRAIEVLRNTQPVPLDAAVRLHAGRDGMLLRLWPATYVDAARIRLEYRLAGQDTAWADLGLERTLRFGALPRGRFRLEVRAVREGQAPGPVFALSVVAVPPFYRTFWFVALMAALAAVLAAGGMYLVQARRLAVERVRLRLASDLHDDLGSGLAQISVLSELLHRRADPEAAEWAERVGDEARSLTARMRDLVWALRPGDTRADALDARLRAEAAALLGLSGLPFTLEGRADDAQALSPEVRRALLLAFREMLTNVVRHAHASHVAIHYHLDAHRAALVVSDDGDGFDAALPPGSDGEAGGGATGGFGLVSLAHRARQLGGRLDVASVPSAGTTVTFEVPLRGGFWLRDTGPTPAQTTQTGEESPRPVD